MSLAKFLVCLAMPAVIFATPPDPVPPVPTAEQLAWQHMELTMFVHFGVNTFSNREWGDGKESETIFNPAQLDARQWVAAAKDAGFKLVILTAKHHDGFCLWPSKFTEHSVKNSPWKAGKGDVVREFVDACREAGLKTGLYLSPWDRNNPAYGSDAYNDYLVNQLTELLTNYGPVDEMWFDGANGEGPNGKKQVYDWKRYYATIHKLSPHALIAISGPDIRWVGNESGVARFGESSVKPGGEGSRLRWYPAECDVSIRPGWFYHESEDSKVKSIEKLMEIYFASAGRNSVLLLNVPPDRRGLFADSDVQRLKEFGAAVRGLREGKAKPIAVSASGSRGSEFCAERAIDDDASTFWSPDDAAKTSSLELDFGAPREINTINVQEAIALGERVKKYSVEARQNGGWRTLGRGTAIGHRNLIPFEKTRADRVRLCVEDAKAAPCIAEFSAHLAPIVPPPARLPLTNNKPARASNVFGNDTNYGADKAVDGDDETRWATSDETRDCWLEVDLEKTQTFNRVTIQEFESRIARFVIECKAGENAPWQIAFEGGKAGKHFNAAFKPVTGRWVRLHILEATFAPTIWEFAVWAP